MATSGKNCIELTLVDRYSSEGTTLSSIGWDLRSNADISSPPLVSGTISPEETTALACFDDDFECAWLQMWDIVDANNSNQSTFSTGTLQLSWNGVVWADNQYISLEGVNAVIPDPLFWMGEECQQKSYEICGAEFWLLDVELTTTTDATEDSVYWRAYTQVSSQGSGVILHDPYYRYYQPNTTFRSLHCIDNGWNGCTELGIGDDNLSFVVPDSIHIRVKGQEIQDPGYECNEDVCDGETVFALNNCESSLSGWAIAGIVIAAVVGVGVLWVAWHRWRKSKKQQTEGEDLTSEQPIAE